jgi:hypothetical protein
MSKQTQLTDATNYDVKRIVFSEPIESKIPNSALTYKRINISTMNDDGKSSGDLILKTPYLFSFGVQENKGLDGKKNGYVMPLCLWNRNGPSSEENAWTDTFNNICEHAKKYLVDHKGDIGKWDLDMAELKKFNPLYWKKDKKTGKIEPGTGPTLYPKLIASRRDNVERIMTIFYDTDTLDEINPIDIVGKYCNVTAAVKIESIFIGNRISLQVKLWEVEVSLQSGGMRRLLGSSKPAAKVIKQEMVAEEDPDYEPDEDSEAVSEAGSVELSEDEEFVAQPSPPRKTVSKRRGVSKK